MYRLECCVLNEFKKTADRTGFRPFNRRRQEHAQNTVSEQSNSVQPGESGVSGRVARLECRGCEIWQAENKSTWQSGKQLLNQLAVHEDDRQFRHQVGLCS